MNGRNREQPHNCYHLSGRTALQDPTEPKRRPLYSHQPQQQQAQRQRPVHQVVRRQAATRQPSTSSSDRRDRPTFVHVLDDRTLGTRLKADGYKLGMTVGEGSFSKVRVAVKRDPYSADPTTAQQVACKVISKLHKGADGVIPSKYVRKFLPRELDVLRTVRHPHVVSIHGIYMAPSSVLVFMEYCKMGDLMNYMRNVVSMPQWRANLFFKQICEAVEYLHRNGIAHRDIKCENILLENSRCVKLTDFGFARMCVDEWGRRVLSQTYCGSSTYAAPEVLQGKSYDPKASDVWSIGVVLYMMLADCLPFPQNHRKQIVANQIVKNFSKPLKPIIREARNLVSIILEPDVTRRATADQIRRHPWVMRSSPNRPP